MCSKQESNPKHKEKFLVKKMEYIDEEVIGNRHISISGNNSQKKHI